MQRSALGFIVAAIVTAGAAAHGDDRKRTVDTFKPLDMKKVPVFKTKGTPVPDKGPNLPAPVNVGDLHEKAREQVRALVAKEMGVADPAPAGEVRRATTLAAGGDFVEVSPASLRVGNVQVILTNAAMVSPDVAIYLGEEGRLSVWIGDQQTPFAADTGFMIDCAFTFGALPAHLKAHIRSWRGTNMHQGSLDVGLIGHPGGHRALVPVIVSEGHTVAAADLTIPSGGTWKSCKVFRF